MIMNTGIDYRRKIGLWEKHYDVIVCGGGPAGCAAAIAAARQGLKTILLEAQGQLGGMATSGLVSHWLGGRTDNCEIWVVGGIFRELSEKAQQRGYARIPRQPEDGSLSPHGWGRGQLTAGIPFDPFKTAALLDEEMNAAGVEVLLATTAIDVETAVDRIDSIVVHNKSGLQALAARLVIDATGDADIAARAGCKYVKGRPEDGLVAPVTLEMHVDGVDLAKFSRYIHEHDAPRLLAEIARWRESGEWPFGYDRFITVMLDRDDTFMVNTSRICGVDGSDGKSVSDGLAQGRRENLALLEIMQRLVPGFEQVRLKAMAAVLGVRETRRIVGDYTLKVDDLVRGEKFDDIIGYSAYGWDLPDPKRPSHQPMDHKNLPIAANLTPLPYRIMLPRPIKNLICPGRAVSVERDVLGPVRVMAPCMAMGEAAGIAAALSLPDNDFSRADIPLLRERLKQSGSLV